MRTLSTETTLSPLLQAHFPSDSCEVIVEPNKIDIILYKERKSLFVCVYFPICYSLTKEMLTVFFFGSFSSCVTCSGELLRGERRGERRT